MAKQKSIKRQFYEVRVPLTSSKVVLYGESEESIIGRFVKLDLTRSLKGKSIEIRFKVVKGADGLIGEPTGLSLTGSYIRRTMRTGIDYVEDSFPLECRDNKAVMKVFLITRNKVSRSIRNSLRVASREYLQGHAKARTVMELFSDITTNRLQKELSMKLKKIYPLALCEIRVFEILKEKKIQSA